MKVLSVRQPWASALLLPQIGKDVENRSWRTNYRGPLVIHASQKPEGDPRDMFIDLVPKPVLARLDSTDFACGAILGIVDLFDCVEESQSKWADWDSDWYWLVRNPRILAKPIPCNGRLQLWDPPATAREALRKLLR
jgi:hypothetical protein